MRDMAAPVRGEYDTRVLWVIRWWILVRESQTLELGEGGARHPGVSTCTYF